MTQPAGPLQLSTEDGLATVRIARRHGNAIDSELVDALHAAFRELEADRRVRGVLLAASGKIFCPGLDLQELVDYDRAGLQDFMERFQAAMLALYSLPKPMIAAISGHALAGGCLLTLTADRRVLQRGALVGLNELRVGLPVPFGLALLLRASVARSRLEEIALVGRNYADDEAIAAGIAHEVREADDLEPYCRDWLRDVASRDARAFALTKRYLRAGTVERIRAGDGRHLAEFLDCWFSEDTQRRMGDLVSQLQERRTGP